MIKEIWYPHVIDVQLAHKLGLIGYRNHAKRLLDIVEKNHSFSKFPQVRPTSISTTSGTDNL